MSVFIIINEWTSIDDTTSSEVVACRYFSSEDEAHDALKIIAESYKYDLDPESMAFGVDDPSPSLTFEEFYIQELYKR